MIPSLEGGRGTLSLPWIFIHSVGLAHCRCHSRPLLPED